MRPHIPTVSPPPPVSIPHCCHGNSQAKHCHAAPLVKHHVFTHHIAGVASLKSPDPISMSRGRVRDKKKLCGEQDREQKKHFWRTWRQTGRAKNGGRVERNKCDKGKGMPSDSQEFCLPPFIEGWVFTPHASSVSAKLSFYLSSEWQV